MDVGLSLWLPGGELGEYHWVKEQREMVDTVLEVGAVRYEMLEALQSWRLTMEGEVRARPCVRGETATRPVPVALDVRFDAVTPAIGTDGQPSGGPKSAEAAAAAGHGGQGPPRAGGALDAGPRGRRRAPRVARRARATATAPGARGAGAARRCGAGSPSTSGPTRGTAPGTVCTSGASGSAPTPATCTGAGSGTAAEATSVAEWRVRTELADDGVTHRVVHLDVVDKRGRTYPLRGDVLRVADIGQAGGTMVNEGLARWTYEDPAGGTRTGYGICEYLHQLDDGGRPVVPVA